MNIDFAKSATINLQNQNGGVQMYVEKTESTAASCAAKKLS